MEIGVIGYDRILLCDEFGDHYHEEPHLLVEYIGGQPFNGFLAMDTFIRPVFRAAHVDA